MNDRTHTRGAISAFAGFLAWGLFPLFWKQLHAVPAWEAVAHRLVWSFVFLIIAVVVQGQVRSLGRALASGRTVAWHFASSALLVANWTIYVWGVNAGHVIECSLGYFLVPLVNVALGRLVFGERVRPLQAAAIALAALGVSLLLVRLGHFPFIALGLAGTWSAYGLLKKKANLGPMLGLTVESIVMLPFALAALSWWVKTGSSSIGHVDTRTHVLLVASGVVTAVPLLAFAYGAQRIRMTTIGLLGYVTPSVQFLLGVLWYREPFAPAQWQSYGIIWFALALYSLESFRAAREPMRAGGAVVSGR